LQAIAHKHTGLERKTLWETLWETLQASHAALAEADQVNGRPAAALACIEPLMDGVQSYQGPLLRIVPVLAWAHLETGALDRAQSLSVDAITEVASKSQRLALVEAIRVKGMIPSRQVCWQEAEAALTEALTLSQEMLRPYAEVRILCAFGLLNPRHKELQPACTRLQAAERICKRLGEPILYKSCEYKSSDVTLVRRPGRLLQEKRRLQGEVLDGYRRGSTGSLSNARTRKVA
jgi:hypothetical protein